MASAPEQRGKPIDEMSREELKHFAKVRKAAADLLTPVIFGGLGIAGIVTEELGIDAPAARFAVLEETSKYLLQDDTMRRNYAERSLQYLGLFGTTGRLSHIYDHQFSNLIGAAIQDAYWAGMGAMNALTEADRTSEAGLIIPHSLGLLAIADVHKDHLFYLRDELGDPIDSRYFRILEGPKGNDEVAFTPEATAILAKHPSRLYGCPAQALPNPFEATEEPWQSHATNLLEATWEEITGFAFAKVA